MARFSSSALPTCVPMPLAPRTSIVPTMEFPNEFPAVRPDQLSGWEQLHVMADYVCMRRSLCRCNRTYVYVCGCMDVDVDVYAYYVYVFVYYMYVYVYVYFSGVCVHVSVCVCPCAWA